MEALKFSEAGENLIVLPARLAEAQAGIEDELRPVYAGGERAANRCFKSACERAPDVAREGLRCIVSGLPRGCIRISGARCRRAFRKLRAGTAPL